MLAFYKTSIGKKFAVAISGAIMYGFVIMHMIGNLKVFGGVDSLGVYKIDHYGRFLREFMQDLVGHEGVLWITRLVLIVAVVVHVVTIISLRRANKRARPVGYHKPVYSGSTIAARLMWYGGLLLAAFIVFHILHLTTGQLDFDHFVEGKIYANLYGAFQHWYLTGFYVLAMIALGMHLYHGVWSLFQTLGFDNPKRNCALRALAVASAVIVPVGFALIPLSIFLGFLPPPV